jgi:hypothetical protein
MYNPLLNNLAQSNAYLKDVDGIPPEQQLQIAIDKAQKGLIPFGVAVALKGAADTLRQRGAPAQMPEPDNPMMKIIKELQGGQGQPQMPQQQQMPPQMPQGQDPRLAAGVGSLSAPVMDHGPVQSMKGGGIVAFNGEDNDQTVEDLSEEMRPLSESLEGRHFSTNDFLRLFLTPNTGGDFGSGMTITPHERQRRIVRDLRKGSYGYNNDGLPATPAAASPAAAGAPAAANEAPAGLPAVALPDYPAGLPGMSGSFSASGGVGIPAFRRPDMSGIKDLVAAAKGRIGATPDRATFDTEAKKALEDNEGYKSVLGYQGKLKGKGASLDARAKEQNRMLTAMLGFQWAANAAKPGARFLGSFAEAGVPYAKDKMALMQRVEDAKDALEDKQMRVAETLSAYKEKYDDKSERRYTDAKTELKAAQMHYETLAGSAAQMEQQSSTAENSYNLGAAQIRASIARYGKDKVKDQLASQFSSDRQQAYQVRAQAERMPPGPEREKALATAAALEKRADYTYETYQKVDLSHGDKAAEIDLKTKAQLEKDTGYRTAMATLQSGDASRADQIKAMKALRTVAAKYHIDPALLGVPSAELGGGVLTLDADGNLVEGK